MIKRRKIPVLTPLILFLLVYLIKKKTVLNILEYKIGTSTLDHLGNDLVTRRDSGFYGLWFFIFFMLNLKVKNHLLNNEHCLK